MTTIAMDPVSEPLSVSNFRRYLRCKTVQPNPDYAAAESLLIEFGTQLGLRTAVHYPVPGKPVIVLTWPGSNPTAKSIVLNSHLDVVPVFPDQWSVDPFAADKVNGRIYARGAQDMKCVGSQYIEAIRQLKQTGYSPRRTFHILFVPDEEIGGHDGMEKFITTPEWTLLNPGLILDEGLANPDNAYKVYHGERTTWWIRVEARGETGHGSQFIANTAGPKLNRVIQRFLAYRDEQEECLHKGKHPDGKPFDLGDVTTINLTSLKGGVQPNVLPQVLEAGFDIRITPRTKLSDFRTLLDQWCDEPGVSYQFTQANQVNFVTPLYDNPWWNAIQTAAQDHGVELDPTIFPAATDARYVRRSRVPAFGISPMRNTPVLLHCHDEYIDENVFLEGIQWYQALIPRLDQVDHPDAENGPKWTVPC